MEGPKGLMFLWLTVLLHTLGNLALGAIARDAVLAPQTWNSWQAVGTDGFFWLSFVELGESFLFLAFQAEPPNSPELVPNFKESRLLKQKVFADFETVSWEDKGREGGPGEGGVGLQWLPRSEQKSRFFASIQTLSNFLHCSCNQHAPPAFT